MASTAEVDLVISTADTLPELERDLREIITAAERSADSVDVQALIDREESLSNVIDGLNEVITAAEAAGDTILVEATLDQLESLTDIQDDLNEIIQTAEQNARQIEIDAQVDADIAALDAEIETLVAELEASAPDVEIEVVIDRDGRGAGAASRLSRLLSAAVPSVTKLIGGFAGLSAGLASALPLIAGVGAAVSNIAPAAAVAVTGLLAVQLASGAVKLAMVGVKEAIATAFDPEAKPEELAKAMEKLSPAARSFVTELRSMRGGFKELQQDVQEDFFNGFDDALISLSTDVVPQFSTALRSTSTTLNQMALGAAAAAIELGSNGTLQRGLLGATEGLANLRKIPGQAVTALGQLAAAAAPAFERITAGAAKAATGIADKLSKAFESGALEEAINTAIEAIKQLGRIAGNIFGGLGNILGTVSAQGEGLFASLEKVTQAFQDVTASDGFQQALKALVQTGNVVLATVLPLLTQALVALGPVFEALGPPVQILVRALGDGLSKVVAALGPVLVALAHAFGQLVILVTPFIDLAANLIAAILPSLVPLFEALGQAINAMVPFVEQLVTNIAAQLLPILTQLATEVLPQLIPPFLELATRIFPVLTEILVALAPSLARIGEVMGELLVAITPLIVELANLTIQLIDELAPVIEPLLALILKLIEVGLKILAAQISGLVIPIIKILVDLLKGDFSAAWEGAKNLVSNVAAKINEVVGNMQRVVVEKLKQLADEGVRAFQDWVDRSVQRARELPGKVKDGIGDLGNVLVSAGRDLVQGLINGIGDKIGELRSKASEIASTVKGAVGDFLDINSPSKVMQDMGQDTMDGFLLGLNDRVPALRSDLQGIAGLVPSFALPNGQSLRLPQLGRQQPTVQVFIGNEQLNGHFDARLAQNNIARDRLAFQGVRR